MYSVSVFFLQRSKIDVLSCVCLSVFSVCYLRRFVVIFLKYYYFWLKVVQVLLFFCVFFVIFQKSVFFWAVFFVLFCLVFFYFFEVFIGCFFGCFLVLFWMLVFLFKNQKNTFLTTITPSPAPPIVTSRTQQYPPSHPFFY